MSKWTNATWTDAAAFSVLTDDLTSEVCIVTPDGAYVLPAHDADQLVTQLATALLELGYEVETRG